MYDQLTKEIVREAGETLASKAQRAELRRLQNAHDECSRVIAAHTPDKAAVAFREHQKELADAIARGDLDRMDGYSLREFEAEFHEKMEAGKVAKRKLTRESVPVIEEIAERFAKIADKLAAEYTDAEAKEYKRFGVPYPGPSALIAALRNAAAFARARVPRGEYADSPPKQCVPYVDF